MTEPIARYLNQLRASLRTPEASRILAEAEDHLREATAAGLAAGLTEREAQQAAISSFGSVRAVVRAHQGRRGRAAALMTAVGLAAWKLAGLYLLAICAVGPVMAALRYIAAWTASGGYRASPAHAAPLPAACVIAGIAGLIVLAGYRHASLQRRRSPARTPLLGGYFPVVAACSALPLSVTLSMLGIDRIVPDGSFGTLVAAVVIGVGSAIAMGRSLMLQRRPAQRTTATLSSSRGSRANGPGPTTRRARNQVR